MVVMHHGFLHLYCFEELDFNIIEITVPENLGVYIETNLPGELFGCDVMNIVFLMLAWRPCCIFAYCIVLYNCF